MSLSSEHRKTSSSQTYQVPSDLLQPLWLRSRESLIDDGLVYDPIAARACQRCHLSDECLSGDIDQKQLLHVTLTQLCDMEVARFLKHHPNAWIINVGAGLDTRFYRLDNGLCHWIEVDVDETLLWRQRLFHHSERYTMMCGSVPDMSWLEQIRIPETAPVLVVCEQALLNQPRNQVAHFVQKIGRHFSHAEACLVLAGDKTQSHWGKKMGCVPYSHGLKNPLTSLVSWLPWIYQIKAYSPIESDCKRWRAWQRVAAKLPFLKHRLTPSLIHLRW
ncbi:class I SAM-dependent methyltransferase [Vibrio gangliei]|uniref:class I SAM-dependent methyltransferase n=1 Tax=Vibrio gangliei TaxID=2077090 RepID=UPI000D01F023|nr:class I SAM-dependent methyltransferase [Vibrio gangliei]